MATKPNKKTTRTRRARKQPATQHDLMVIPRDHIIPFRANVFGLTGRWSEDDHVTVLDPDRRPNVGDKVAILWADKARRPEFGYFAAIEYRRRGPRRVQLLKGAASAAAVSPGWFKLGDDDLLAREIGTFIPCKRGGPREEGWPRAYKKLCHGHGLVRTKEQWDLAQVFEVDNPADSPWPGWERLSIDPDAPLGPDDWVAAIEPGATPKKRKVSIGKVAALKRSFEIEDVTTGRRLKLGGSRQPYHGVVIGMSSSVDAFKRSRKATKKVGRRD